MITLVIGPRNGGKTTYLQEIFHSQGAGAWGFCSEKVMEDGQLKGYNLVNMRTSHTCPLARLASGPLPADFGQGGVYGRFVFADNGFRTAQQWLDTALENRAETFFMDELGQLELQGRGHAPLIEKAVSAGLNLYITIRDIHVKAAAERFGFGRYTPVFTPPPGK